MAQFTVETVPETLPFSERLARSVMKRYGPDQMKWNYDHGLVIQSVYTVGKVYGKQDCRDWAKWMYDSKIDPQGNIAVYKKELFNVDLINSGRLLFDLYREYGDEQYQAVIEKLRDQLKDQPRTPSGGFWHKGGYPNQMWLDGLYMYGPFYARYAAEYEAGPLQDKSFADIVHQFSLIEQKTRDPKTGLLFHAWDESKKMPWANPETGLSPHLWGRAVGWYCMALLDVLDFIPDVPAYARYRKTLSDLAANMVEPLLKSQDRASGLWYQVMDLPDRKGNYLESSASAMFIYFFYKLVNKGFVVDAKTVLEAAAAAFAGLKKLKIDAEPSGALHLRDICGGAGLGVAPGGNGVYRDGSFEYYAGEKIRLDDPKGVGPLIFAALEIESMKEDVVCRVL
ncbi:family 88 glycosyl hydrolase [Spirochaetia bacterium]|nr:family 88 glycosyl hydrolase [Spirochaetia bacterium]